MNQSSLSTWETAVRHRNHIPHLPRSLHVDGDDMEAVAAQLAGPAPSLANPLQQAVLVGVPHRAVTPTRVQQVALETSIKWQRSENFELHFWSRCPTRYSNNVVLLAKQHQDVFMFLS